MPIELNAHVTRNELAFLEMLGSWSSTKVRRDILLRNYLAAMSRRRQWGALNQVEIEQRVCELLAGHS